MDWLEKACKKMVESGEAVSYEEAELLVLMMSEEELDELMNEETSN